MIRPTKQYGILCIAFDQPITTPEDLELRYANLTPTEQALLDLVCANLPDAATHAKEFNHEYELPEKAFIFGKTFIPGKLPSRFHISLITGFVIKTALNMQKRLAACTSKA